MADPLHIDVGIPVKKVRGQILEIKWPENEPPSPCPFVLKFMP